MSDWNSTLYLKFKKERTQPAIDLANRVRAYSPKTIADIGCGPGNSTAVVKSAFPNADILGIDTSPAMIEKARAEHPDTEFRLCGAEELEVGWDMLFSNACLQWIPDHDKLLPSLMSKLNCGGVLAVQVPMNRDEPLFKIIAKTAADPKWGLSDTYFETNDVLAPEEYYNILSSCSADFQLWQTVYCHALPTHEALIDWVRGTRLRPYLDALAQQAAADFEAEITQKVKDSYPVQSDGAVLLNFRRLFFVAQK